MFRCSSSGVLSSLCQPLTASNGSNRKPHFVIGPRKYLPDVPLRRAGGRLSTRLPPKRRRGVFCACANLAPPPFSTGGGERGRGEVCRSAREGMALRVVPVDVASTRYLEGTDFCRCSANGKPWKKGFEFTGKVMSVLFKRFEDMMRRQSSLTLRIM